MTPGLFCCSLESWVLLTEEKHTHTHRHTHPHIYSSSSSSSSRYIYNNNGLFPFYLFTLPVLAAIDFCANEKGNIMRICACGGTLWWSKHHVGWEQCCTCSPPQPGDKVVRGPGLLLGDEIVNGDTIDQEIDQCLGEFDRAELLHLLPGYSQAFGPGRWYPLAPAGADQPPLDMQVIPDAITGPPGRRAPRQRKKVVAVLEVQTNADVRANQLRRQQLAEEAKAAAKAAKKKPRKKRLTKAEE